MKKMLTLLLAAVLMLSLTACGRQGGREDGSPEGSVLVYGSEDYDSINPIMNEHCEIKHLLFDGLLARSGDGELVPALAESWSYEADSLTYTFQLRSDVSWHDGAPFTAEDVRFTIESIRNPENGSENAPNYEEIAEIQVKGEHEIKFILSEPNVAFPNYMTMSILPRHLLEGEDLWSSDYFRAPVGTGPYRLTEWDVGQAIVMEKNEDYFGGPAHIDRVIFKIVTEDSARALQLREGSLDLAQITPKDAAAIRELDGLTVYDMDTADYRGILYNFQNEYWQQNADLIPAISYAIDRQVMVDAVLLGAGFPAYSPIQLNRFHDKQTERYEFDLSKSEAAFLAAGCERDAEGFWSRNGARIGFTISATPGDQVRIDMAQIAAQQLQEAGLEVRADVPANGIDWEGQECCIIGWGSPFDADDHTYKVFGSGKGANYSGYSNEAVDRYLTMARQTEEESERAEAYRQFEMAMAEAPAYTFFCYIDAIYGARSGLSGVDTDTVLGHHGVGLFWNITQWTLD